MLKSLFTAALFVGLTGCYAATRSTVDLGQAERQLAAARAAGAPERAVYAWTMADEYMKKARDEWARSDYQRADEMVKKATKWAAKAAELAQSGEAVPAWSGESSIPAQSPPAPADEDGSGVWQ